MQGGFGERGLGIRSGVNKQGWEKSQFPVLCETCLGENPYVRMTKSEFAKECKVCTRPFTVFRYKPGSDARFKKTEICQNCAKLKNVCQTCLFDLDYGLPVEVRDKAIVKKNKVEMPKDIVNRDYWANNVNQQIDNLDLPYKDPEVQKQLQEMADRHAKKKVDYRRNKAHVCSFYVQGKCTRGAACEFRHEDITEEDLKAMQKGQGKVEDRIRDRYNGVNDPIAKKILGKIEEFKLPDPPSDLAITTFFVGGVTNPAEEEELKQKFGDLGKVQGIKTITSKKCAFVCFYDRREAEKAFEILYERLFIGEKKLKLLWAKSQLDLSKKKKKKAPVQANASSHAGHSECAEPKQEEKQEAEQAAATKVKETSEAAGGQPSELKEITPVQADGTAPDEGK